MRTANLSAGSVRQSNVGLKWREELTNTTGEFRVPFQTTFRVRASAGTTVTIDGELAMTMAAGEVEYFNVGAGAKEDDRSTVKVEIGGAAAFVQVAEDKDPGRRTR